MEISEYLKNYQPVPYKVFENALLKDTLSHAYLLVGESVTPLKEIALFLAKSILCDNPSPFCCDECITCKRINENKYRDFFAFNMDSSNNIKKEDIELLQSEFSKTAFERKGKKVYIINLVETMGEKIVNAILKFLEEPQEGVYAFLTTNNIQGVLPTIVSRCQTLKINPIPSSVVIEEAKTLGVNEEDAILLSSLYNDAHIILKESNKESFQDIKQANKEILNSLLLKDEDAFYQTSRILLRYSKDKNSVKLLLDFLSKSFEEILLIQAKEDEKNEQNPNILNDLAKKLTNVDESLIEILKAKKQINSRININLLINHLIYVILKEEIENGK